MTHRLALAAAAIIASGSVLAATPQQADIMTKIVGQAGSESAVTIATERYRAAAAEQANQELQQQLASTKDELAAAQKDLTTTKTAFDQYKIGQAKAVSAQIGPLQMQISAERTRADAAEAKVKELQTPVPDGVGQHTSAGGTAQP